MVEFLKVFGMWTMFVLAIWKLYDLFFKVKISTANHQLKEVTMLILMYYIVIKETGSNEPDEDEILQVLKEYKEWSSRYKLPENFIDNLESALQKLEK